MSDFTDVDEILGTFTEFEADEGVDFIEIGDEGLIIVNEGGGWGDLPWGDEPWGGESVTVIISGPTTVWTNIDSP